MTCSCELEGGPVSYEDLLPYILPAVGDVPDAIAAQAAREALIEFGRQTGEIKAVLTLDAQRGLPYYTLKAPDGYTLQVIEHVDADGITHLANPRVMHGCGFEFDIAEQRLILHPAPSRDVPRGIEVIATVSPGQDACYFPRTVYDRHAELISHGAKARLYRMKAATDWYDPQLAGVEERLWRDGLRWARVNVMKGGSNQPTVMRAPRWC